MKKGMNMYGVPGRFTLREAFSMLRCAGYDGVELNMEAGPRDDGTPSLHAGSSDGELNEIRATAEKNKLEITSLVTPLLWKYPLTANDIAVREKGKALVARLLDAAAVLGAGTVLVVPGAVNAETHYEDAYNNALTAIRELSAHAEKRRVHIGVENVWNKMLLSPLEMRGFIDAAGSDWVGAYFDIGNVLVSGYPDQWIQILGDRIRRLHAKGFKNAVGNITGFTTLLAGDIDWTAVMAAVRGIGYDGYITAELDPYDAFPANMLKETSTALDSIFAL